MTRTLPAGTATGAAAVLAGALAFALAGVGQLETVVGAAGLLALFGGVATPSGKLSSAGGGGLFLAILLAALAGGAPAAATLAAGVAALLAWTWAHTSVGLQRHLGAAGSGGLELTHVAGTAALGIGAGVVGFLAFGAGWPELSPTALLALVVGAAALVTALRRSPADLGR